MAVTVNKTKTVYNGAGSTGPYPIDFPVVLDTYGNARDIKVYGIDEAGFQHDITADCTVTGLNVFTTESYPATEKIVLSREPALLQESQYQYGASFPAKRFENDLDRIYHVLQNFKERLDRSFALVASEDSAGFLPERNARKDKLLFFNENGDLAVGSAMKAVLYVSAFMIAMVGKETAGDVLTHLGISDFLQSIKEDDSAADVLTSLGLSPFFQSILASADAAALMDDLGISTMWQGYLAGEDLSTFLAGLNVYDKTETYAKTETYSKTEINAQRGYQKFTADGTFTVPANVTKVKVTLCGSGGNSGTTTVNKMMGSPGGSGAYGIVIVPSMSPGQSVSVIVGQGKDSSFGSYATATKGGNGINSTNIAAPTVGNSGSFSYGSGAVLVYRFVELSILTETTATYKSVPFGAYVENDPDNPRMHDYGGAGGFFGKSNNYRRAFQNTASRGGVNPGEGASACMRQSSSQSAGLGAGGFVLVEWGGV